MELFIKGRMMRAGEINKLCKENRLMESVEKIVIEV